MSGRKRILLMSWICGVLGFGAAALAQDPEPWEGCGILTQCIESNQLLFGPDNGDFPVGGLRLSTVGEFGDGDHVFVSGFVQRSETSCPLVGVCPPEACLILNTIEQCPYVPTVSKWGLMALGVAMLMVATIIIRRRAQGLHALILLFLAFLGVLYTPTLGAGPTIEQRINQMLQGDRHPENLLVRFNSGRTRQVRDAVHAVAGAEHRKSYRFVDGLELVYISDGNLTRALTKYLESADVLYAEPDYIVKAVGTVPNDTFFGNLWGLHNTRQTVNGDPGTNDKDIDAPEAWDIWTGDPDFRIAVIDTGVDYTHPDLASAVELRRFSAVDGLELVRNSEN